MRLFITLFLLTIAKLYGDESLEIVTEEIPSYDYWGQLVHMLLTLSLCIVLIFATVWLLKKIMRSRIQNYNKCNGIKILERRPLNSKASLYLIDVLGKGCLISESAAGIHVITEFPEGTDLEKLLNNLREEEKPRLTFKEIFSKKPT